MDVTRTAGQLHLDNLIGLTTVDPLYVSKIIQQISLGLNHQGVDVKVVTSFVCKRKCIFMPEPETHYYLDSSFIFSLVQESSSDSNDQPRVLLQASVNKAETEL